MKLNWIAEFKVNSIEAFAWGGMILGSLVFLGVAFWDEICGQLKWHHSQGWGYQQIIIMAVAGLYVFWGFCIADQWGE